MTKHNYTYFERNLAMMVIYVPVKFEFDWTNHFRVRDRKQKCIWTDRWTEKRTKNRQTNIWNYTNFKRNLAMMVIYVPVMFEFDWTHCFRVGVQKRKCGRTNGWTEKRTNGQTNEQTELQQFQKEPSYDGDLSHCQVLIRLDKPFSS